jgi:putative transcriptional regulator
MITRHPSLEMLLDYASGEQSEALALGITAHAALCSACRARIGEIEAIGGTLLDEIETAPVGEALLAATLARLDEPEPRAERPLVMDEATRAVIPAPLQHYVGRSLSELPWKAVGRLYHESRLPLADAALKASLMRLRPGSLMPKHTHCGNEYTLVLAGGFSDVSGHHEPGDFAAKDSSDHHQPQVDPDAECLCFVVLDAPVKLTGPLGRLVNPFLRI